MNITAAQVNELRQMTGAGMMDCKKALVETEGNLENAIDLLRKKGIAKAAKRADREASEGAVLSKSTADHKYAALVMVNCETDFVAQNADFVKFAQSLLDLAVENRFKTVEELKAAKLGDMTVEAAITNQSAVTGEKTELGAFHVLESEYVTNYNHPGNRLATIVSMNKSFDKVEEISHEVALQVAAMSPIAVSEEAVAQEVKDRELAVAIEKTKEDQISKAVEVALKKAGFNLYIAESEEHLNEGVMKGHITEAQAQEIRDLKVKVAAEKAANLPEQMVQSIANGRMAKFFKENCLLDQISLIADGQTVRQYIQAADKDATVTAFYRIKLGE